MRITSLKQPFNSKRKATPLTSLATICTSLAKAARTFWPRGMTSTLCIDRWNNTCTDCKQAVFDASHILSHLYMMCETLVNWVTVLKISFDLFLHQRSLSKTLELHQTTTQSRLLSRGKAVVRTVVVTANVILKGSPNFEPL